MKISLLFPTVLTAAALLSACNEQKPIQETGAPVSAATQATLDSAGALHHSGRTMAGATPLTAAINAMMAKMTSLKMRGNTDHDFARMMLEHHQGAIALANIELREGRDATMRQMATKIKADQQREVGELTPIAERLATAPANYQPQDPTDPFTSQLKASMAGMMNLPASTADSDLNFNLLMTAHHQSAVTMAQAELARGNDSQLRQMARQLIDAQQKEIQRFKAWHAQNAGELKPTAVRYQCPMNDGGQGSAPGQCPKCGMAMVKKA